MEIIKITENEGQKIVSARDLHGFLGSKTEFSKWCVRMFEYGFIENQDYTLVKIGERSAHNKTDYALTLDTAKEISMLQRSKKGKEARQYFIECERKAHTPVPAIPQTQAEMLLMAVQNMVDQERKVSQLDNRLTQLEAKTATRPEYMTIMGYAILTHVQVSLTTAAAIGRKASKICKEKGYTIDKIKDPRFGLVGSYPESVLEEVFKQTF